MSGSKLFLVFSLLFSTQLFAAEYYLSISGSDTNIGSRAKPWASLQKSIWKLKAGDILIVRGGTYTDSSFADISSPSNGKVTTIRAEKNEIPIFDGRIPKEKAVLEWRNMSKNVWVAKLDSKWERIDGLWVSGKYVKRVNTLSEVTENSWWLDKEKSEAVIHFTEGTDPNAIPMEFRLHSMIEVDTPFWNIQGMTAQYFNYAGFTISSTHNVTIQDCKANHNGGAGIEADEASKVQILNNETAFNGAEGGPGWASGIHLWKVGSTENLVKGNRSFRNWDPSDHHTDGNGIAIDKGQPGSGAEVSHNSTYENGGRGIDINVNSNAKVHHNLIYSNGRDPLIREFGELCISESVSTEGIAIHKNTIRAKGDTPAIVIYKADPKAINSDENVVCQADNPNLAFTIYQGEKFSLQTWQKMSGLDMNSTSDCAKEKHTDGQALN
jgi:hypothetical protein